ncbi:MAG: HAD-IA family hydrolase [Planctomycetales bacterium]
MRQFPIPSPPLRAVVFDMDGLMFNTEGLYEQVDREILARRGKDFPDALCNAMMGRKSSAALQVMIDWHDLEDSPEKLTGEIAELFEHLLPSNVAPMQGLMPLLEALENTNIPKAIATSSGRIFTEKVLSFFSLEPRFEFVLTGDDIQHGKPAPDVYRLAAKRLQVDPEEMMVLEDSQIGCQAAMAANAYVVAIPHGRSTNHQFSGVQFEAKSLADRRIHDALRLSI